MTNEPQPQEAPVEAAAPADAITGEVIDREKQQAKAESVALAQRQREDVDHLAEVAMAMPGVAGRDEFLTLAMQARVLSMSGAAPKLIRGNPHIALHVAMIGRDLGVSPSAAIELIDVMEVQGQVRVSLSPQLLNGQIRRLGLGSIVKVVSTDLRCVAVALGPGGFYDPRCKPLYPEHHDLCTCTIDKFIGDGEFTWQDAQMAGLAGSNCQPGDHKKTTREGRTSCGCNSGYEKYPKRMMWWRASGFCADDYFPEAGLGLYTAEEVGAMVDADGRAIDASAVEVPPGFEPTKTTPGYDPAKDDTVVRADAAELWELQERVFALPDDARATFRERWGQLNRLKGQKLVTLEADRVELVKSVLRGIEQQTKAATKGAWTPEAALEAIREQEVAIVIGLLLVLGGADPTGLLPTAAQEADPPSDAPDGTPDPQRPQEAPGDPDPGQSGGVPEGAPAQEGQVPDAAVLQQSNRDDLEATVTNVKVMGAKAVDAELKRRLLSTDGVVDERKRRLVIAMLRDKLTGPADA